MESAQQEKVEKKDDKKVKFQKESLFKIDKYFGKRMHISFQGGREAIGVIIGCDGENNILLDQTIEFLNNEEQINTRSLGLIFAKGSMIVNFTPYEEMKEVQNPFLDQ